MPDAVANYARYKASQEAWMLGRFVVPVARLDEFESVAPANAGWRVSALTGADLDADLKRIARSPFEIDTIEMKAADERRIESTMLKLPRNMTPYFEITDLSLIPVIWDAGGRAKIRTGGITPDAFPAAIDIARFLVACSQNETAFKATAGLHHPLRCYCPLTYSADGPSGWMYGFLNVFVAAMVARMGADAESLVPVLMADSLEVLAPIEQLTIDQLDHARRDYAIAFGSCSFEEPIEGLKQLKLL